MSLGLGRLAFGSLVLLLLAGCSGSFNTATYSLAKGNYKHPGELTARANLNPDDTLLNPAGVRVRKFKIHTDGANTANVAKDQAPARSLPEARPANDENTLPTIRAAMAPGRKTSSTATPIEDVAKGDPENVALRAKTNICRGC